MTKSDIPYGNLLPYRRTRGKTDFVDYVDIRERKISMSIKYNFIPRREIQCYYYR